jgi:hypothetical protein
MLTLEKYLEEIRRDKKAGWSRVFSDILGQPLSDKERFLKVVDNYGDLIVFESLVVTSSKRLTADPLNYVIAVANQKWRDDLISQAKADEDSIKTNRAIENSKNANQLLYEKIEEAKRRIHAADDTV